MLRRRPLVFIYDLQLREDIEYFVDSNQEPDYQAQYEDAEDMYEVSRVCLCI